MLAAQPHELPPLSISLDLNVGKQKSFIGNLYFSFDVHPSHLHKCEEVKMQSEESQITEVFTAAVAED